MTTAYTVQCRDLVAGSRQWSYIDIDLNVVKDPARCKPLTLAEARKARRLMIDGAAKLGRLIECKVIRLDRVAAD